MIRVARPAYRIAEGPMSTPRRPAPRSRGAPMTATLRCSCMGTASDGLAAIELADELSPDAVVIDLHMPRLDGVTAVARLRRDHPSMCVIALTGDEHPALHKAVTEAGADAVLVKGEFVDVLVERLAEAKAAAT